MECFSTAYLFYMGLQILVVSCTRLFFTAKVFWGGIHITQHTVDSYTLLYVQHTVDWEISKL